MRRRSRLHTINRPTTTYSKAAPTLLAAYVDAIERMIMDSGLHHAGVLPVGVVDVHGNSGDIDSLLSSSDPADHVTTTNGTSTDGKPRRLLEPYERHRAHDLRAECYRRGIRPIKKGPNANDNKNGYIVLLRKFDGTAANGLSPDDRGNLMGSGPGGGGPPTHGHSQSGGENEEDTDENDTLDGSHMALAKKRKLPSSQGPNQHHGTTTLTNAAVAAAAAANELAGFYDTTPTSLVPVLPMQYPNLVKPPSATPTTSASDLEILSGIANSYTTQTGSGPGGNNTNTGNTNTNANGNESGMFCGNCRTIVTDQLMESIRLGRNKMQMIEFQRIMDQRDRDTIHLKETITVLRDLRRSLREAQNENRLTHELLVELEDDIAFFQNLKERTKDRMRKEMQERAAKQATGGNVGTT